MCQTANQYRVALYNTVNYFVTQNSLTTTLCLTPDALESIHLDRQRPEYQIALAELRAHVRTCQHCQRELNHDKHRSPLTTD